MLGALVEGSRNRKELSVDEIFKISGVYHAWREGRGYEDIPGFCNSAKLEEIRNHHYVLTPGRYVGAADIEDDDVPFPERLAALSNILEEQFSEANALEERTRTLLMKVAQ
jgi:type I restriction enzyme M protein